jgi:hypothetical protein
MRSIHPHTADLVILHVQDEDLVLRLRQLHFLNTVDIGRHHRPTAAGWRGRRRRVSPRTVSSPAHGKGFSITFICLTTAGSVGIAVGLARGGCATDRARRRWFKREGRARQLAAKRGNLALRPDGSSYERVAQSRRLPQLNVALLERCVPCEPPAVPYPSSCHNITDTPANGRRPFDPHNSRNVEPRRTVGRGRKWEKPRPIGR